MEVANRKYRFRALNASASRSYGLSLSTGDDLIVIGTDAGLLSEPIKTKTLRIGIAERYGFIIDFSKYPIGTQVVLRNLGADNNVDRDARTSVVMRFDVVRQESDDSSILVRYVLCSPFQYLQQYELENSGFSAATGSG
jgi:FtsP/CotA-like multicopper oxidase with cupredoxin domain